MVNMTQTLRIGATRTLTWIACLFVYWRPTAPTTEQVDRTHSLTHSHAFISNTVTTTVCEVPAQLLQNLESNFSCVGTWGRGCKPEYPEKTPDSLPTNRYHTLARRKSNIPDGNRTLTSNIGDKLAWPRAHAASDPLSYRPPQTEMAASVQEN